MKINPPKYMDMINYLVKTGNYSPEITFEELIKDPTLAIVASACNMPLKEIAEKMQDAIFNQYHKNSGYSSLTK